MSQQIIEGYQMSPQQRHLWSLFAGREHTPYTAQCAILMVGPLDEEILRTALRNVIERHEILRTTFSFLADMTIPLQIVNACGDLSINECDLSDLSAHAQDAWLQALFRGDGCRQFTLYDRSQPHFLDVQLAQHRHMLLVSLPSLYADSLALKILTQDLADCYAACLRSEGPPAEPIQYAALSEWQNESLKAEGSEIGIDYWLAQEPVSTVLRLPFEQDFSKEAKFRPESLQSFVVNPETVANLERLSALHNSSLSSSLLACFFVLLSRLNESADVSLGVSFDGRNYDELADALGLFARFLPIHAQLPSGLSFPQLLASLDRSLSGARRWQELFTHPAEDPFLPFCFEFVDDATPSVRVTDTLHLTLLRSSAYISRFNVLLRCLRQNDGSLVAEWHYDAARYDEMEVDSLAQRWVAALESISVQEGAAPVEEVEVLGAGERTALLQRGRGSEETWGGERCVHEIFAAQAARTPEAIALVYEGESVTYSELNSRADRLAASLRGRGVRAEQRVGLMMERGVAMLVGMLGIMKAGGAYVPLERTQPSERLALMVKDAGVRVVVSVEELRKEVTGLREVGGLDVEVYLDSEEIEIEQGRAEESGAVVTEENIAYVIYTSGSSGSPKGVCVEHRQLTNYLNSILQKLSLPAGASFALVSTFAADLGNTVIFPALCSGGTLHVISTEKTSDPGALANYFSDHSIDCLKIVPSHLSALMAHSQPELVLPRKCLVLGGEASSWQLIERIKSLAPGCRIINHYGPTETTVGVLTYAVEQESSTRDSKTVPLGYPIANTQVYLLDKFLRPVPPGVSGELHIGGANLARGYLNRPETTAARFIPNPFSEKPGTRLYKTGDLSRILPDGSMEFLGRTDDQVKVRGFRTEPGEIEAVLKRHQVVEQIKVLARDGPGGDKRLVAYLVPEVRYAPTVRQWLRLEREGRLNRRQCYELPNRMLVASQNKNETDFMYKEIFEEKIYLQHGVGLNNGDCVFDVGANIGMFSLFVSRMCKNAKIYAFEPIPPLYELLRTNVALYGLDAKLFKCGVSADTTRQEFTYYPHLTLMSGRFADLTQDQEVVKLFESNRRRPEEATQWDDKLLDEVLTERMTSENFICQMKRISDVIREHQIERINLLKIDVQKSEMDVLRGIDEGDWARIEQVVLEVHDIDDRLHQIVSLLETQGFQVAVQQEAMLKETGLYDIYCVRRERVPSPSSRSDEDETSDGPSVWTSPNSLIGDVRAYLKANVPDHMIPSAFVLLESIPLTPNGKIDRQALPEPVDTDLEASKIFVGPRTATEEELARIWREVLGVGEVGMEDNFFELGGDSILSIQIVARANQAGLKLSPKHIFRHQSIGELAAAIAEAKGGEGGGADIDAEQGLLTGAVGLTPIQHYFFGQSLREPEHFNQSLLLLVRRRIEAERLQEVVAAVVAHHDGLRLRFEQTERGWEQRYGGEEGVREVVVQEEDVSQVSGAEQSGRITAASDAVQRSLRLEGGGLLRVVLFETGAEQRLLLVAHHLVVDGVSWRVLVEDLGRGLEQAERGEAIELGRKTTSYRRWAERLAEYAGGAEAAREQEYWNKVAEWEGGKLPVDFPGGQNTIASARTVSATLDDEETRLLLQVVPEAYRTQINDVLLTALVEAVGKWSGQRQVLVDMEGHGREELWEDIDLSRTVGWFTTLFPVILELGPTTHVGAQLKSVKEQLRRIPNRGIGYGLLRYLSKNAETSAELLALPQAEVRFNYLGRLDNVLPVNSLLSLSKEAAGAERNDKQQRAYLIDVSGAVSQGRLQLNVIYSENLHRRAVIEELSNSLIKALRSIISHCQSLASSDFSPSDFPLANLSQAQLDRIISKTNSAGGSK